MKTRILFVVRPYGYGGMEKHLVDLIRRLDLSTIDPAILSFGTTPATAHTERFKREYCIALPHVPIREQPATGSVFAYLRAFRRCKPHIVAFVNGDLGIFPLGAYLTARLCGARHVVAFEHLIGHPPPPQVRGNGLLARVRRLAGWRRRYMLGLKMSGYLCSKIVCVSRDVRRRLVDEYGYPEKRTLTILNGVDLQHYDSDRRRTGAVREELKIGLHDSVLVSIARLVPQKRIDVLLQALSLIAKRIPSCRCLIVGDGSEDATLRAEAMRLGVSSSVCFVGWKEDVRPYLEAGDIYVAPSEREGFGLTLTEAMACSLPCVATDVAGHNEIVLHGQTGLLVRPGSAEDLAAAITHLLADSEERKRMGANARKRVQEHFNIEHAMARVKHILLEAR